MSVVVLGYVATPEGDAALDRAVEEARARSARLVAVMAHREGEELPAGGPEAEQRQRVEQRLMQSGVAFEVRGVRGDDAAEDIVTTAEQAQAELVVIGLRRRSPVGKLLLGSNAQRILLEAHCPVLAVKAED
jgi:nucleotide-binding universal stress UspA family protein